MAVQYEYLYRLTVDSKGKNATGNFETTKNPQNKNNGPVTAPVPSPDGDGLFDPGETTVFTIPQNKNGTEQITLTYIGKTADGNPIFIEYERDKAGNIETDKSGNPLIADYYTGSNSTFANNTVIGNVNTIISASSPACFLGGTFISTPTGERPIESLKVGDVVSTADGPEVVRFISHTSHHPIILDNISSLPVLIKQDAFGAGLPKRDFHVSPDHAFLIEGHLIQASALINGLTVLATTPADWDPEIRINYYNIELQRHAIIEAEGLPAESFVDNVSRRSWDNYDDYIALYHGETPMLELLHPRIKFTRQIPSFIRIQLEPRIAAAALPQLVTSA